MKTDFVPLGVISEKKNRAKITARVTDEQASLLNVKTWDFFGI